MIGLTSAMQLPVNICYLPTSNLSLQAIRKWHHCEMRSLITALILLKICLLIVLWQTVTFSSFARSAKVAEYEADTRSSVYITTSFEILNEILQLLSH